MITQNLIVCLQGLKTARRGIPAAMACVLNRFGPMISYRKCNGAASMTGATKRGALIVMEGCDHAGKTTHAKRLVDHMNISGRKAIFMQFPDRTTKIGGLIDEYLTQSISLEDHVIHLLFSANRWENLPKIMSVLEAGTSVVIDRYAFSGVAFSAAKKGLELDWCKSSDAGLPKPDAVLFLDLPPELAATRGKYGSERYEKLEFQQRVYQNYMALKDGTWKIIDSNNNVEEVQARVAAAVDEVMEKTMLGAFTFLWE